ncbi:MAG: 50S ribosomal protein L25 [candidate division WWE3 bacterium]|nr:50S ribosomal protein L25 [candidate division WWE3 bacterium]
MTISASPRDVKSNIQTLIKDGILPAVVFGKETASISLSMKKADFAKVFKEAGESTLIDLMIDGEKEARPVLVSEMQLDPLSGRTIHVAFHQVQLKEKVTVEVPVVLVGESPVVKNGQGVLLTLINEIEVEAFPRDLPKEFSLDISGLTEVGMGIHIRDLKIADTATIKNAPDELVVKIDNLTVEEEPEVAAAVSEAEAIAGVQATKELTEEEKKKREDEAKAAKKTDKDK